MLYEIERINVAIHALPLPPAEALDDASNENVLKALKVVGANEVEILQVRMGPDELLFPSDFAIHFYKAAALRRVSQSCEVGECTGQACEHCEPEHGCKAPPLTEPEGEVERTNATALAIALRFIIKENDKTMSIPYSWAKNIARAAVCLDILAALRPPVSVPSEWQPIETAPKGLVLVTDGKNGAITAYREDGTWYAHLCGPWSVHTVKLDGKHTPKYWMPRPKPPVLAASPSAGAGE
jgi:hypothetical protein